MISFNSHCDGVPRKDYPSDILNRLKWKGGESLDDAEIVILHRGAPGDRRLIHGKDVRRIGHMFFDAEETSIPFHRVLEIKYRGEVIFEKRKIKK